MRERGLLIENQQQGDIHVPKVRLEYVDWADAILAEPLAIVDGAAALPARPGTGVVWDEKAVMRYRIG